MHSLGPEPGCSPQVAPLLNGYQSHAVLGRVGAQLDLGLVEGVHRLGDDLDPPEAAAELTAQYRLPVCGCEVRGGRALACLRACERGCAHARNRPSGGAPRPEAAVAAKTAAGPRRPSYERS